MRTAAPAENRKQLIFRFDDELTGKLKYYAKRNNKSMNSFVEDLIIKEIQRVESIPHLEIPEIYDQDLLELAEMVQGYKVNDSEIEEGRYRYLMEK